MGIRHTKVSGAPAPSIPTLVGGPNWDADHAINGDVDWAGHGILNLDDPIDPQDAATKAYVDANAGGGEGINVTDSAYGAVGDGVTDDTDSFVAALADAVSEGVDLVVPVGTFVLTDQVWFTGLDGVRVRGTSRNGSRIRFPSAVPSGPGTNAFRLQNCNNVTFENMTFVGDTNDDAYVNGGAAIYLVANCKNITVRGCNFEHNKALTCSDSAGSSGLVFDSNYIHNAPLAMNPSANCKIVNNEFICDAIVNTRSQAIYTFGQQTNIFIQGNTFKNIFKQCIQIRASNSRFQSRDGFRVIGNHFENCNQHAIWVGTDDQPDIGEAIITGNTFKNCILSIAAQGFRSGIIANNLVWWDWEWPFPLVDSGGINVYGDIGQPGHWGVARGTIVANNKFIVRHPWVGKIKLTGLPNANDTITIGVFTYTWKVAAANPFEVTIAANIATSVENLRAAVAGTDVVGSTINPVLRYVADAMCNKYAASYGLTDFDTLVIASWADYVMSKVDTAGVVVLTQAEDYRIPSSAPLNINNCVAPLVHSNHFDDTAGGIVLTQNLAASAFDNVFAVQAILGPFRSQGNVHTKYRGNRHIEFGLPVATRQGFSIIDDGFAIIEDDYYVPQDGTYTQLGTGRCGIIPVGDGKAHTFLYYGQEIDGDPTGPASLPFRWNDGDLVRLYNGAFSSFTFKRTAPGAGQFNSADSLVALINAASGWAAAYATYNGATNPKKMIRISYSAAGAVNPPDTALTIRRCKSPSDTVTYLTVQQPLINGICLRETDTDPYKEDGHFYGGSATLTKTFVHTPLANKNRPVLVQGYDASSEALTPKVYQADIVSGVGFTITHGAAAGTEKFFWRVG